MSQQDMALIKSVILDIIIVLDKHVLEKILTCVVYSIHHVYKVHIFHQLMKGLGYVLKINTQYFELTMQKETKYVGYTEGCVITVL